MRKGYRSDFKRRDLFKGVGAGLALPTVLRSQPARAANIVKIGFVVAKTGPLAAFGEPSQFIVSQVRTVLRQGIKIAGETYQAEILERDSESDPNRAADVTADLINSEGVDMLLAYSAPDTVNPVADQAEANQVPCITNFTPWQTYFFGRKGDPNKGFIWTYHFSAGLEDLEAAYIAMWDSVPTNRIVGGLFANDTDGNAFGDARSGLPGVLPRHGYKVIDTGRFQPGASDYTAQINAFKESGCDVIVGNLTPPDFSAFWTQAGQQNLKPKIVTIGRALLFPSAVQAIGSRGDGLSTEIWWTPHYPFKSGLTGQSCADLCAAYSKTTGKPWTQPLGYAHALFEVAVDVLKRTRSTQSQDILNAITATDYQSIVGPVKWGTGPVKNVTKTPLVAGQWHQSVEGFDLVIDENATAPEIPIGGKLSLLS